MAGTELGGRKAAATNKMRYGLDFYRQIGHIGGINGDPTNKGWAHPDRRIHAAEAGHKGGVAPRRHISREERTVVCVHCHRKYISLSSLRSHRSKYHTQEMEAARSHQIAQGRQSFGDDGSLAADGPTRTGA